VCGIFADITPANVSPQLKSNRSGHSSSVLNAVRQRHGQIQQIEKTVTELSQLMNDLVELVVIQEKPLQVIEEEIEKLAAEMEANNIRLEKAIERARNLRRIKRWCLAISVLIAVILALVLGLYFGLKKK